jgi:predicted aspartyl protease
LTFSSFEDVELLVDSGSTHTWVSKDMLDELGIKQEREREFKTIEGKILKRTVGMGIVEFMDERAPTIFVFAEEGDAAVLGVHALEGLGFKLNPVTKQLEKVEAILAT